MSLTRLSNLISSTEGRFLYVDPNEFNASDLITNRGNSPTRPFKTIQRALLEVARFSYVAGPDRGNDKYDQYTVLLSPGDHWIDNRPGYFVNWDTTNNYWDTDEQLGGIDVIPQLTDQSNFDIFDDDNDLFKFNSYEGGVIIPRGTSLVGSDLRKTRIRPRYVPDPMYADYLDADNNNQETTDYKLPGVYIEEAPNATLPRASFFRVTGGCYFWQFSIFDAVPTNTGGIYRYATNDPADNIKYSKYSQNYEWKTTKESLTNTDTTGLGSHHKLTGFAFANGMTVPDINLSADVASGDTSISLNKINSGSQARIHMGDYLLIDNATNASKEIVRVKKVYTHLSKVDVYRSQLGTSAPVNHTINTTVTKLNDLGLFYAKVARGFSALTIEDRITDAQGEVEARQQENRIVGPLNVDNKIASISISKVVGSKYKLTVTTRGSHGLFKGQIISLIKLDATQTSQAGGFGGDINGTVFVSSVLNATTIECEKILAPNTTQQTYVFDVTAAATLIADIDTVDSASPYIFNCSIRSVFGICGMFCDGSKSTGFKSMVVAQYTGVSLQKDDRAFIKYMYQNLGNPDISQNILMEPVFLKEGETGNELPSDPTPTKVSTLHSDGAAYYQDNWRTFHIHIRYEGLIQAVSVFAVGFCDHHLIEDGGDISITNSNSNFGNTALRAVGFREKSFPQDKVGKITHIIPPKELDPDEVKEFSWYPFDVKKTQAANTTNRRKRLYLWEATLPTKTPTYLFDTKYIFGGKKNEFVYSMENITGGMPERKETYLATNTDSDGLYENVQIKTFNVNPNTNICKLKTTGDSYRWYTGTPVRVSSEVGYLPDGMTPNTTYYIITENGSRWKDSNWSDGTGNISTVSNEFKLAKTVEEARAGTSIDLRSQNPPTNADINNPNKCELKIYQYTSDIKPIPITHEFKTESTTNEFICVNDASAANYTEIPHGFDAGQPIFFSKTTGLDTLPNLSNGQLSTEKFYYAYPTSRTRFRITQDDTNTGGGRAAAISGNSLITLGNIMASGGVKVYANAGQWTTDTEFAGANGTSWESRQPIQYDPTRLNNQVIDTKSTTAGNWCILTKHSHVTTSGTNEQAGNSIVDLILTDNQYTTASGGAKTTRLASIIREKDVRPNYDRTYRFRYVLPKDNRDARPPFLGYVVKLRTNDDGYVMDTWAGGASTDYTQYDRTYYVYDITEIQDFIPQVQDGVYYLTLLLADIAIDHGTMVRGESGNLAQNWFKKHKFSQNVAELYPALDADNPIDNPPAATSCADHRIHGWVYSDLRTSSITRESAEAFLLDNNYTTPSIGSICNSRKGFARRGREDQSRLFQIGYKPGNSSTRSDQTGIEVELRRPSLVRSGNHTFEYVGYGPGNYSTAFPSKQQRDLSEREVVVSQSKKEDAGVVFYSGLNSQGDLYVGTQKINAVTGQIEIIDESILEISSIPVEEQEAIRDENPVEGNLPRTASFWNLTVMGTLTVEQSNEDESLTRKFGWPGAPSTFYGGVEFNTPREGDTDTQRVSFYGAPNGYDPSIGGEYEGVHGLLSTNNLNMRATYLDEVNNEWYVKTNKNNEENFSKDITLWSETSRPVAYASGDGQAIVNLLGPDAEMVSSRWGLGKHWGDLAYKPKASFGGTGKNNQAWIYLPSGTGGTKGHWYQTGLTQTGALYPFEDQTSSGASGSLGINEYYRSTSRRAELYVKGSTVSGAGLKRDYFVGVDDDSNNPILWMKKTGSGENNTKPSALFFTNSPSQEISQMKSVGSELYSFEVGDGHTAKFHDEVHMDDNVYIQDDLEFLGANSGIIVPTSHNAVGSYQTTSEECFFRYDGTTSTMSPSVNASAPLGDMGSNPQKSSVYSNWSGSGKEFTSPAPTMFDAHIRDDIQNQALPVGAIIIWGGSYSNLPKGYCLCDGATHKDRFGNTISVPDLRDKFVKGGSTTATGSMTGGYDVNTVKTKLSVYGHELSRPEVPAHSHGINHNYFRHTHGIQVQVGLNDLIGAAAGTDNPDAAFGTQWGSAAHTKVTVAPDPLYDGQNSQSNTFPGSNNGAFLDISGKGNMRSGPGTGGTVGGGGGSTTWNTIYGPGHTSQNYVEFTGSGGGSWQTTWGPAINVSPVRTMDVNTTATSSTWSQPPNVTVDINWDLGGAGQIQQNGIHTTNLGWTSVLSNAYDANNYMASTVSSSGVGGSGMAGFHFFYQGKLRAINPWNISGGYTNGTWNYWGCYRFKGEGLVSSGGSGSVTVSFVHDPANGRVDMVCGGSGSATITVDFSWLDNPNQDGTALGSYNIPSLGISCTQGTSTSGTISSQTATVTGGQTYQGTYTAGTNLGGLNVVAGANPGIEFWDGAGTDANATFTVSQINQLSTNDIYRISVERMTFGEYNHSSTKRYLVGDVDNIPSSATHTTSSQMNFLHEIEEQTFSGGGGGGTYNFYYNGSNVGSNTTGATITAGSLRYIMGSSVGNNQYQIQVQQQQSSGGTGDGWHDFTAVSSNPGIDDPRRTDTPTGSGKAGNTLGKQANNFHALHHHHPFQFSNDGSSAGVNVTTTGSSGYGQGINSYGASLDEFSTLTFTLDNRPAYLELCYICKL